MMNTDQKIVPIQVAEYKGILPSKLDLRVYTVPNHQKNGVDMVRYCLGLPKRMLTEPMWTLGWCETYLGEKPYAEVDGYFVISSSIVEPATDPLPTDHLNRELMWTMRQLQAAANYINKASAIINQQNPL